VTPAVVKPPEPKKLEPAELLALLESDEPPVVVDVRAPVEFERFHISGSVNVPFRDDADAFVAALPEGAKAGPIAFYDDGGSSKSGHDAAAAALERGAGKALWFEAGLAAWQARGLPFEGKGLGTERVATAEEVARWLAAKEKVLIIDVRTAKESRDDPFAGTENAPLDALLAKSKAWPAAVKILLVDYSGGRSRVGYAKLIEAGVAADRLWVMDKGKAGLDAARKPKPK
jgi:rhodanese-related sulfurtransferase